MDSTVQHFCLRWNNHSHNIIKTCEELYDNNSFTDVTLVSDDGQTIRCHKVVLAACSTYFNNILHAADNPHPMIVLKDVSYFEIKSLVEYMYKGEVNVLQDQLDNLMKVADDLKIKGLTERGEMISPAPTMTTSLSSGSSERVSPPCPIDRYHPYGHSSNKNNERSNASASCSYGETLMPYMPSLAGSYNNSTDSCPLRKKKVSSMMMQSELTPILRNVLGHASPEVSPGLIHPDINEPPYHRLRNNGSLTDNSRRNSGEQSHSDSAHSPYDETNADDESNRRVERNYRPERTVLDASNDIKPDWKRYKQYTRHDIAQAIEAVREGMSALQAARKFNVPSRTLYDKVKKLGIRTSRPVRRSSSITSGARFPYGFGVNLNGDIYNGGHRVENNNSTIENEPPQPPVENIAPAETVPIVKTEQPDLTTTATQPTYEQRDENEVEDLSVKKTENNADNQDNSMDRS